MVDERLAGRGSTREIYTVANMITVLRLLLVPFFFMVLIVRDGRYDLLAFAIFVLASSTDFLDGMIARRTGHVTAIGKIIDPLVDRLLIAAGVVGLYILERLDIFGHGSGIFIVLVLVLRDVYLLYGAWVLERHGRVLPVLVVGKITTAVLLTAFSGLMLGTHVSVSGVTPQLLGGYLLYVGLVLSLATAVVYTIQARRALEEARREKGGR